MAQDTTVNKPDDNILSRECKFVIHLPEIPEQRPDTHVIKELITYKDGTSKPNLRLLYNFKRPFWVTKEHFQNHKDKKESEYLDKLNEYQSTQSSLGKSVAMRLGQRFIGKTHLRDVSASPYVYGLDIHSKTVIKKMYLDRYPDAISGYNLAILDIETNTETDEIIVISLTMRDKIYTVINKKMLINTRDIESQLNYLFDKHIPKTNITENIKKEYVVVENELELILKTLEKAHIWKPDIIAIWNIDYDIPKMLEALEKYNIDPKDVFSDPNIPKELRYFEYKQGQKSKVTASGKFTPINPEEQWHTVIAPASFYWIDAMSAHRYIRVGGKTMPGGYSLDNILKHELGNRYQKLKFEDIDNLGLAGIEWHQYMVKNKPLEYIIYNQWDVISMLHLDEKTKDLAYSLPILAGVSSFDIFNSGPKRIVDALHFFYIEHGKVLGSKPPRTEVDTVLGLKNWINNTK